MRNLSKPNNQEGTKEGRDGKKKGLHLKCNPSSILKIYFNLMRQ